MNPQHERLCASAEWEAHLQTTVLPAVTDGVALGDEMLELRPGQGASTDCLRRRVRRLVVVERDELSANKLRDRFEATNGEVVHGDATQLPVPSNSFDSDDAAPPPHTPAAGTAAERSSPRSAPWRRLLGSDSLHSDALHHFHHEDTYNPIEPATLLGSVGRHRVRLHHDRSDRATRVRGAQAARRSQQPSHRGVAMHADLIRALAFGRQKSLLNRPLPSNKGEPVSASLHTQERTLQQPSAGFGDAHAVFWTATRRKPLILLALLLAAFAINLDTTIVNVALPTLVRDLHASTSQLQWVVDAYNLAFAALLLASGSMSDRMGRKGMLLAGLGLFGLASVAGSFTTSAGALIVARALMGVGAAAVFPATLSLISNVFTERAERARAIGLWGATAGMAVALGPIVGGWLLERFSWSSIFFAMAPVAAAAVLLVWRLVPASRDRDAARADRVGLVLSAGAMAMLIFTIIEAPAHGWGSARTLGGFGLAVALLAGFAVVESRVTTPMLDIGLFRNPRFTAASGSVTIAFFNLFGFIFLITQYFQFFKGYTPLSAGLHLLPVALSIGATSILGTKLAVRFGTKLVVVAGLLTTAGFYVWVATVTVRTGYLTIAAQMVLYGTGMGLTSAPATEAIMGVVPKAKAGVGSAVNDATRLLGGTLGVAVIGSIYASLYASRLTTDLRSHVSPTLLGTAQRSAGAALAAAHQLTHVGHPEIGAAVNTAAAGAFIHGLSVACLVSAAVAGLGAVIALALLPAQPSAPLDALAKHPDAVRNPAHSPVSALVPAGTMPSGFGAADA